MKVLSVLALAGAASAAAVNVARDGGWQGWSATTETVYKTETDYSSIYVTVTTVKYETKYSTAYSTEYKTETDYVVSWLDHEKQNFD